MIKIAIHSAPRSGSTWLGSIFDSSPSTAYRFQPLFSYTHKGALSVNSSIDDINRFYREIYNSQDGFVLQEKAIENQKVPRFKKDKITHIVYKEVRYHNILENLLSTDKSIKVIGLIRNPFSTINSWLKAPKEFKKELKWKESEEWKYAPNKNLGKPEEYNGYVKWKEVAFLFLKLDLIYPNQFYIINYDDLILNKNKTIKHLFRFCDLTFTKQTQNFLIQESQKEDQDPYSVFKQKTEDNKWENELPRFIIDEIKQDKEFQQLNNHFKWI